MRRMIVERGEWLWWAVLAAMALPLLGFAEVPTLDGPAHVYTAAVLRELAGPDPGIYGRVFRLELCPWPNWAVQAVLAVVGPWMGWRAAEKAVLLAVFLRCHWRIGICS
jgi:hypothetical protein